MTEYSSVSLLGAVLRIRQKEHTLDTHLVVANRSRTKVLTGCSNPLVTLIPLN